MPILSFWPEKATEWVALMGGLLGISGFVLSILNYRRDRARLRFTASQETYYPDQESEEDAGKIYIPDTVILKLRVTNLGRRPIRIESAGALLYGMPLLLVLEPEKKDIGATGSVLTESEPTLIYVSCPLKPDQLCIEDVVRFEVCDSAYRTHRHYHRNRLLTLVRQVRSRLRVRSQNRNLPKPRHVAMSDLRSSAESRAGR
jgi:hypothetical protein